MSASLDDLKPLIDAQGPFLTVLLPAPSQHSDAAERFAVRCKNALKQVSGEWPAADLGSFEQELAALPHNPPGWNPTEPLLEFDRSEHPFRQAVLKQPLEHVNGIVQIPTGPGLGIEIDRDAVRRFEVA